MGVAAQTAELMKAGAHHTAALNGQSTCLSRREFLGATTLCLAGALTGCHSPHESAVAEPIIDIHQHVGYMGRPNDALLAHQRAMGVTQTILLPAGRPVRRLSTHDGFSNGLQAHCEGNLACYRLARSYHRHYHFAANEVPDLEEAPEEIRTYLEAGGVMIAEQKFGVDCDSEGMQKLYQLAADYQVPVLMHWQQGMYNFGFERFHKMLEKYPSTIFLGHAQTWWAHIDKNCDPTVLYPKGKVIPGGLTDRYLSDYANMYGDLSAGSGLNALMRDEEFTRDFLKRHQSKLLYGSDCDDWVGSGTACQGAQTIATVRRLAPSKEIERKLLYGNARQLFRL
jgi:predicted TIM-barrel fold metal-dependent hydrolase